MQFLPGQAQGTPGSARARTKRPAHGQCRRRAVLTTTDTAPIATRPPTRPAATTHPARLECRAVLRNAIEVVAPVAVPCDDETKFGVADVTRELGALELDGVWAAEEVPEMVAPDWWLPELVDGVAEGTEEADDVRLLKGNALVGVRDGVVPDVVVGVPAGVDVANTWHAGTLLY